MTTNDPIKIVIPDTVDAAILAGESDGNLRVLQDGYDVSINMRGNEIKIQGGSLETEVASLVLADLMAMVADGAIPDAEAVKRAMELRHKDEYAPSQLRCDVLLTYKGHSIHPKTAGQKRYADAIRKNAITFGIGPAGTGKTYLAMAMAIAALRRKEVGRIILSRPIIEAGENLGFLPGTLTEKVDPYIRPLYDALYDMVDAEQANYLLEKGVIEIAPLAFMRGRTLNESFVILDEAQNTTPEQMKMFLTRLGYGSKMVVTGDMTQSDLPRKSSGLRNVQEVLKGIEQIDFCYLKGSDVVRNSLVSRIINAYEEYDEAHSVGAPSNRG